MNILLANKLGADPLQGIGDIGTITSNGIPFLSAPGSNAWEVFRGILSLAIGVMTVVGFIWFFFLIVTAAISWMSSGGEKNKIQEAQKRITNAIVGIVLLVSATLLIRVLEVILGVNILSGIYDVLF